MRGRPRRVAVAVGIVLSISILALITSSIRKCHLLQDQLSADACAENYTFASVDKFSARVDAHSLREEKALVTDLVPNLAYNMKENQVQLARNRNDTRNSICSESSLEALFVFTLVRADLLDLHLLSIDFPVKRVFVIQNGAKSVQFQNVSNKYQGCNSEMQQRFCANHQICNFHVLSSEENIGYAGSFNAGIKLMLENKIKYALFSGDDTRFMQGRLKAARRIMVTEKACMYHFEGYSSFGITLSAVNLIGPMDENFWPAYCEDCDYWYRAQLAGCRLYYRGGYVSGPSTPNSQNNSFMEHGDVKHQSGRGSATFRDPHINKLVTNTLHPFRGRFQYLRRKWGFDTCVLYHKILNQWRAEDEILNATSYPELSKHGAQWFSPYNDSSLDIRHWIREESSSSEAISSRAVNSQWAPMYYVWKAGDYARLQAK